MSRTVTVASLMTQARQRADMIDPTGAVDDTELGAYVLQSWTELYDLLVQTNDHFFTTSASLAVVGGTASYALTSIASAFYKLDGVDVPLGGNAFRQLKRLEFGERNTFNMAWWSYFSGLPSHYGLVGANLTFYPTPSASLTARVWYTPAPPPVGTATGTALDGYSGWEEFVVIGSAIKMLVKTDQLQKAQMLEAQKALVQNRIITMARRDVAGPAHVTRTRYVQDGLFPFRGWF